MNKKTVAVVLVLILGMLIGLCACGNTVSPTEPESNTVFYFNVHRAMYDGKADDALTARPKNPTDATFHILMAHEGTSSEFQCQNRMMTNKIDTNDIVALTFEEGLIAGVQTVEEAGFRIAADHCYVVSISDDSLLLNTNNSMTGQEITLPLSSSTAIYDVSDEEAALGAPTALMEMDEIVAVAREDGTTVALFVISRLSQRNGRTGCICGAGESGVHTGQCDGTLLSLWQPWTNSSSLPTESGYWYLETENQEVRLAETVTFKRSGSIYIDLNGHTVYSPADTGEKNGHQVLRLMDDSCSVDLVLLDSAGGAKFILSTNAGVQVQAVFAIIANGKHSLSIYGGTVDGTAVDGKGNNIGGLIRNVGKTLNIYGGTILSAKNIYQGSAVWSSGDFTMTGGEITGGTATTGGNVYIATGGSFHFLGGSITGGTANALGGNVYVEPDATYEQTGGILSDGQAVAGADIYQVVSPK